MQLKALEKIIYIMILKFIYLCFSASTSYFQHFDCKFSFFFFFRSSLATMRIFCFSVFVTVNGVFGDCGLLIKKKKLIDLVTFGSGDFEFVKFYRLNK